jgi:DNA-binding transcriptional regulator of glucitol operon
VSGRPSKLSLLSPKWLLLHVFTLAVCCAMLWLGQWQWHAGIRHHGEIRNFAYALQWWAFVGFTLLMWFRIVADHLRSDESGNAEPDQPAAQPVHHYRAYIAPASAPAVETDPERLRLNAYLAQLHTADREAAE